MFGKMLDKILDSPRLWDLSRFFLDLICGLYRTRMALLKSSDLFKNNPSVLDIGCGTGLFAEVTQGYYLGIDSNHRNIMRAMKKKFKTDKTFRCVDLNVLQKEGVRVDVVLITDVLHHLDNEACIDLLSASSKITKKYLVSFEPVLRQDMTLLEKWFVRHDKGASFRYSEELRQLFRLSGYAIIENRDMRLGHLSIYLTVCRALNKF